MAIRTLLLDKLNRKAEYGVGGGIVWDSTAKQEWEEAKTKARILGEIPKPFDLIETLRWSTEEGWFLLEKHLKRLGRSAIYFNYPLDPETVRTALENLARSFGDQAQRVRLSLDRDGQIHLENRLLTGGSNPRRVGIARTPVTSTDRFLYHKTTRREVYERARQELSEMDESLLWNERGELTEACIANLVVELDGGLYTPPVSSGLLAGTYRAWLLEQGKVKERVIRLDDLERCGRVYLANSVRGIWEVDLIRSSPSVL